MLRQILSVLILTTLASQAIAESAVPDRRQVVTLNTDFFGADISQLFDISINACQAACMANDACQAYTFNNRKNACFLKSEVLERQAFDGATSAEMFATDPSVLAQAVAREDDLAFLTETDANNIRKLALGIGARHPGGQWSVDQMLDAARGEVAQADYLNAMRWTGAIVARTDTADQWAEYARLSMLIETQNSSDQNRYGKQAFEAAANAYLRAPNDPMRVTALMEMAPALERVGRGRDMVRVLRLAEAIQPRADVLTALEGAVAKYGFRITDHRADNESAAPRICAEFSEPLIKGGTGYTPFVQLPSAGMVVEPDERQLCIDGVQHGERYQVTFRKGLPAASGETLIKDVEITLYVRDRAPAVNFPGRAYVLPKSEDAALPVETVNLDEVDLKLSLISDRNLLRLLQNDFFGRPLDYWADQEFSEVLSQEIWSGKGDVQNALNQTMTTRLPLGDILSNQPPGIYALTARVPGEDIYDSQGATQWFVLSDLGLTTLKGNDGLHVFVKGLGDAMALEGVKLTLLSRSNSELGTITTDAMGHARFDAGLTRGTGGAAPAMVIAESGNTDLAFLSLTDPAFDLSDRGVEGRSAAPPVDVFLTTDRGAYRAGEVIYATALARNALADAIQGLPLTAILRRPDGVEYSRHLSSEDRAGGHVFEMPVAATAPRGAWTLYVKADPDAPVLATQAVLVEDFLPERIDFDLTLPDAPIRPRDRTPLTVSARYLFGAPGAGLRADGLVRLRPKRALEEFPGYEFGVFDERVTSTGEYIEQATTESDGQAVLFVPIPKTKVIDRPFEAQITVSVREGSGRPVERDLTRMLAPAGPMIGIKPVFDDVVPQGTRAEFDLIAIDGGLVPMPMAVKWTVNRIQTRYQWYEEFGSWNWEPITTRTRIDTGEAQLGAKPLTISAPVDWGRYEIVVERMDGTYVASSSDFYAGWYAPADASSTPDTLELSLDQPNYRPGDEAQLRIVPRYAGTALITVMSNSVIDMQAVEVTAGENVIPIDVTEEWGAGAYVTAQVVRPMDVSTGRNPARSLGLAYAKIDPGQRQLSVAIDAPEMTDPRGPLEVSVNVDGLGDAQGFVTLAAVDVGILNLTRFESPDPSDHYFGQRRLGVEIRDLYGRLIDGMNGAQGQVRSGGDANSGTGFESPPPQDELVAYFSGPIAVDANGVATASLDVPDFNGTVRLMAVAWTDEGVGQAESEVLIRDPVVVTASIPRFLAPGDESLLRLEVVHTEGPAGRMGLDVTTTGLTFLDQVPSGIDLAEREQVVLRLPFQAGDVGDHDIRIALTTPDGKQLVKEVTLGVRSNDPEVAVTRRFSLGAGDTFTLDDNVFADLRPGSGSAIISAGALAKLNAPGLLTALDRYPYGCTEQVTSRALPLLYFGDVADALGLSADDQIQKRVDEAVGQVLSRQASNGAFGLWQASSGDFWLDAYVSDFLSRARSKGYMVPRQAFTMAMDNLRNRLNYAPDFDNGGEDIAYALMVLAREGAARMGDLRYFADVKANDFATPMALAQLGSALASYGDQTRADRMFALAMARINGSTSDERNVWRADYGTHLRDHAAVLTLAVEAGSNAIDAEALVNQISAPGPHLSTQEQVWTLLAANALVSDPSLDGLSLNGAPLDGPMVRMLEAEAMTPQQILNTGDSPVDITLTTLGVPRVAPGASGYGYAITRSYHDMDGNPVSLDAVETGTRLVVVLTVNPFDGGEARLMINDPLPAGLEIDNPNLLQSGDIRALDWLATAYPQHTEFRSDRFLAAVDWRNDASFDLAYIVRAVSPGSYHHPAASVEDMYRPQYRAITATGRMRVTE
ncbi:MAG: alpha-2-macroglobulin family protein [Pseudomonadota bacterium]